MKKLATRLVVPILTCALFVGSFASLALAGGGGDELIWESPVPVMDPGAVSRIYRNAGSTTSASAPAGVTADSCQEILPNIYATNSNGDTLWSLTLHVSWCYDGSVVTYYNQYATTAAYVDWNDLGTEADTVSYPPTGYSQTSGYHRQHFARCAYFPWGWSCWDDSHPWIQSYVYGYGGWSTNAGY